MSLCMVRFVFCLAVLLGGGVCLCVCVYVCQRMFAFILEDCVLPVSVCHPTRPAKIFFLFLNTPSLF